MRSHPYSDAPRLPLEGPIDLRSLVSPPGGGDSGGAPGLEIEIGPGRGGFLFERLAAVPDARLIGFEIRRKWAKIVDDRLARDGFGARCRVFAEDAKHALERAIPDASIAAVFLNFPDPWWKKRHQKRLVMQPELVDSIARLLIPGGDLFIQTDVEERAAQYDELLSADRRFVPAGDSAETASARLTENPYRATSHRERRAVSDGIPIFRIRFRRAATDPLPPAQGEG